MLWITQQWLPLTEDFLLFKFTLFSYSTNGLLYENNLFLEIALLWNTK